MSTFSRPLVMFGPSGTGKSTLVKRLIADHPDKFGFSVSHTTRQPRTGEEHGKAYNFTTRESFLQLVSEDGFVEHAEFGGNLYGTSVAAIQAVSKQVPARRCILDIDAQGVRLIKKRPELNPVYLFVAPPSRALLKERLVGRGSESEDSIAKRLAMAEQELEYAAIPGSWDVLIVNDDLDRAYSLFERVALGEEGVPSDGLPEN
ncbi:guanylate kinase [Auriculariales sp. MPI-PUGE-AT-0066]|nr:guanylate kinase [Auriculariales sp. MPI-PUGE-AT-0066]